MIDTKPEIGKVAAVGFLTILIFFGVFGYWAISAPLASGSHASGVVGPDGSRRTIQHLEGGIVQSLNVANSDHIDKDDVVLTLEDTQARAEFDIVQSRLWRDLALYSRLEAEQARQKTITFDSKLESQRDTDTVKNAMKAQQAVFKARHEAIDNRRSILESGIIQLRKQIEGSQLEIKSLQRQLDLIRDEASSIEELVNDGLSSRPRFLSLLREKARLEGSIGSHQSEIARSQEGIAERNLEIAALKTDLFQEVSEQISQVKTRIIESENRLKSLTDRLARTAVRAPVSGTICVRSM